MKRIISLSLAVSCLVVLIFNIEVTQQREAWALQAVIVNTTGNPNQVRYVLFNNQPAFITLQGLTRIIVYDAKTTTILANFNMTNALMNGFSISYAITNMDCNSTSQLCVIGYTTSGTGNCALSPNLCRERVVLVDYRNSAWTNLAHGWNYTYTSNILGNVAYSFGGNVGSQDNIFVTYQPNGGGNALIDTLVVNRTQSVNGQTLLFGGTFTTNTATNYGTSALGTFLLGGICCSNFEAEGLSFSGTAFIDFNRGTNTFGCSLTLGQQVRDIYYTTTNSTYWYVVAGTKLYRIAQVTSSTCNISNSVDLTTLTGGNNLNSVTVDPSRNEVYTQSNNKVFVINSTSFSGTPILQFASPTTNTASHVGLASYPATQNGALAVGSSTTQLLVEYWNALGGGGGGGGSQPNTCNAQSGNGADCVGQLDCSNPANVNIGSCIILKNPNANGFSGTGGMLNQSSSQLFCAIGLIKCNFDANGVGTPLNSDVKTNGVGYLIAIIGLAILISLFWVAGDHDLRNIPTFVWFIAVLGLLGAMVALNWLDPTFFIIAIIALVALGVAKAKGALLGDSF